MPTKINVAVVGLGYWGPNILRNLAQCERCEVMYCCDLDRSRLALYQRQYPSVTFTQSYDDILNDPYLHAIAIATPVASHYPLAKAALTHGKHVLLEKPMASSVEECEHLIKLAQEYNRILMIDHTFLYTDAVEKIKEMILNDHLGEILYFDSERINLGLIRNDVDVIWDLACHDISIMCYLFPDMRPEKITVTSSKHVNGLLAEIAHITILYHTGTVGHIHASWLSPVKIRKILLGGSKKMVVYDDIVPSEKIKIYDKGVSIDLSSESPLHPIYRSGDIVIPKIPEREALKVEMEHFLDCIQHHKMPKTDGQHGLNVVKILEACSRNHR